MEDDEKLYILNFRYVGGHDSDSLQRELKKLGWKKIANMTTCYVIKKKERADFQLTELSRVLSKHVNSDKPGSNVSYGISEYIPPNQRPDEQEGMGLYTLFEGQWKEE